MIPDALLPVLAQTIVAALGLARAEADLLADQLRAEADELHPALRAAFMATARSRLSRSAAECDARECDRHGGFKSVYFEGDRVVSITRPARYAPTRLALLEVLIQHAMYARGHNVPRAHAATVGVVGTPCVGLYRLVVSSERMTCTLAEFLQGEHYAALPPATQTNACVMMLSCVCHGLHKLHAELGIRHGDLKPDNVMLRGRVEDCAARAGILRRWCLIDFGLTKGVTTRGGDIFFLCWFLVHVYAKHVPAAVLRVARRVLRVKPAALAAHPHAATFAPTERGYVDFARVVGRADPPAVTADADANWRRSYGLTKHELYTLQRAIDAPDAEPSVFVRAVHRAFTPAD
jgi:hypothetical protein